MSLTIAHPLPSPTASLEAGTSGVSRRTLANRRNALRSTGPRTPEGKARSRRNAVKLGLSGKGVVLPIEVEDDAKQRTEAWKAVFQTRNQVDDDLVEIAATTMTRLRHCWREESLARARLIDRAEQAWDHDREAEITTLVAKLGEQPEQITAQLKRSAHGAAWLLGRWQGLAVRLEAGQTWDEEARTLALDLLGVPALFRDEFSPVDRPDAKTNPTALHQQRLDVVHQAIDDLREDIEEVLAPLDDDERSLRLADLLVVPQPEINRLVRYERMLASRVSSLVARLRGGPTQAQPHTQTANKTNPPISEPRPQPARTLLTPTPRPTPGPEFKKTSYYEAGRAAAAAARDQKPVPPPQPWFANHDLRTLADPAPTPERPKPTPLPDASLQSLSLDEIESRMKQIDMNDVDQVNAMTALVRAKIAEMRAEDDKLNT